MTAPDEIYIAPDDMYENGWARPEYTDEFDEHGVCYIRDDIVAAKYAEIARLQAAANDFALKWATVCDERDSLQARLDAVDKQRERQTQQNTLDEIFASRGTE